MTTAIKRKKKMVTKSKRPAAKAKSGRDECPHCRGGSETFRYMKNIYRFDISTQTERPALERAVLLGGRRWGFGLGEAIVAARKGLAVHGVGLGKGRDAEWV